MTACRIAVDWGSSAYRAFLLDAENRILAYTSTDDGVLMLAGKSYSQVIVETCGDWLKEAPGLPVIMGGAIGSRNGWKETPYVSCDASIGDLASACVSVENDGGLDIQIAPGVSGPDLFGGTDVMRGEELQIFGAIQILGLTDALICLPGTHSKWCVVEHGKITSVTSFMTGEMFGLIRRQSMIGSLIKDEEFHLPSFLTGVEEGSSAAGLLHKLFSIRADILLGNLACASAESYLSGMLVGAEVKAAADGIETDSEVLLIGNAGLTRRYTVALGQHAIKTAPVPPDQAFVKGISVLLEAQKNQLN